MSKSLLYLNGSWKVKEFEYQDEKEGSLPPILFNDGCIDAEVPGDIHNDLYKARRISDPYYADNSKDCEWVTEKDWYYYTRFILPNGFLKEQTKIVFEGIDTYSTIWLNGRKIGNTDNMFREFSFDISELVKEGEENELVIKVSSIKHIMKKIKCKKYFACFNTPRIFVRKAQCHFGWDWAPNLPAVGIWQGVKVISSNQGQIIDVTVRTRISGEVSFFIKLDREPGMSDLDGVKKNTDIEYYNDELLVQVNGDKTFEKKIDVRGGKNHLTIEIKNPKLWWPNGYGEPNLYNYTVKLLRDGSEIDKKEGRFGIREVELIQEPIKEGGFSFRFHINRVPVFCKGANWVPIDCFTGTVKDEKYENLILLAKDANINMLRVWGGGIYEKDIFYDLCDQNGIMVWQDFMFACSDVPDDHCDFVDRVIPEIEYQVKRLNNHASIVYWCGGNEKTGSAGMKVSYGEKMFHYIIRGICSDIDPTRPYSPASPFSFSDLGNDQDSGDTHCNCLEHSIKRGITEFREEINNNNTVFNSECAILGPSSYQSMSRFIPKDKLWPLNDLWEYRFADNPYNTLEETYLGIQTNIANGLFGKFDNVKEFLKKAMTGQYEILRSEIEHQRIRKWYSGGVMFWMYSDIWPTGTWAVVDYYELPKPAYYGIKKAFEPLIISIQKYNGRIRVYIINDLVEDIKGKVEFGQAEVDGKILWQKEICDLAVNANQSMEIIDINDFITDNPNSYLFARFKDGSHTIRTTFFHGLWKDIEWQQPELSCNVIKQTVAMDSFIKEIEIECKKYARMVNINLPNNQFAYISDNFFDMEAGEKKQVMIKSKNDFDVSKINIDHWLTEWI